MFHHLQYWLKAGLGRRSAPAADARTTAQALLHRHGTADAALRALGELTFDPPRSAAFQRDVARALRRHKPRKS